MDKLTPVSYSEQKEWCERYIFSFQGHQRNHSFCPVVAVETSSHYNTSYSEN